MALILSWTLKKNHFMRITIENYWKISKLKVYMILPRLLTFRNLVCKNQNNYEMPTKYFPKNIVFFGTDNFSLISLQSLLLRKNEGLIDNLHVVTSPQKSPYPAIPKFCKNSNISYDEWPLDSLLEGFDLGIVASFGYLIPQSVIEAFPLGIINVHGSLLPRWRGSAPIIHAILNRDEETGITIMRIHPHKFDVGEILYQEKMPIGSEKSACLTDKMAVLGAKCLVHCLDNCTSILQKAVPQPSEGVTSAPKIKEDDCRIIWERMSPDLIHAMFLAFDDHYHLWCYWHGTKIRLKEMRYFHNAELSTFDSDRQKHKSIFRFLTKMRSTTVVRTEIAIEEELERARDSFILPGQVRFVKAAKVLRIMCLGGYVDFSKVALHGRKTIAASMFNNGYLSKVKQSKHYFQ